MAMQANNELNTDDTAKPDNAVVATENTREASLTVHRVSAHRSRLSQIVKELESEKFELTARLEQLRKQADAVDQGFNQQIEDVEATLRLYEHGLNSVPVRMD
jgi:predicted RNase H-like nuclease (RuvC/YqgF family)